MTEQLWTIVNAVTGEVLCGCFLTPSVGAHPKDHGWAWDAKTQVAHRISAQPDPAVQRFDGEAWIEEPARLDATLHARIDAEAGVFRLQFITDVPGQQLTYQRKEAEARAHLAGEARPLPFLEAEARATGLSLAAAAAEVLAAAELWSVIGSRIEELRIAAKRAVSEAATAAAKHQAAAVDWTAAVPS